jgi:phosphoglycolate phosphatase-like HAD superfamily hydrolase
VSKYARAAAEFVNLYSKWRGVNRFPALVKVFDLLEEWPEVQKRGVAVPRAEPLRKWTQRESKLGNPALRKEVEENGDPVMKQALAWSEAVNASVEDIVHGVPPFPLVRESLERISPWADILVCSATPGEALRREWAEHGIDGYVTLIAGQEMGSKKEHIKLAVNGRYRADRMLMIGDAPGDLSAGRANGALFFPINPGEEEISWQLFFEQAAMKFRNGTYDAAYEGALVAEFERRLPDMPPWKRA